jgi:thiol:disulfide interchange protein DsbD
MSVAEISNPYIGSFAIGLFYGLVVCTASCLPYVASYIAGVGAGFKSGVKMTFLFNSGRILAYTLIGALIGVFSGILVEIAPQATTPFQNYASLVFGAVTVAIGISILWRAKKPAGCGLHGVAAPASNGKIGRFGVDFGAFSLGFTRGLIVCPPLIALLVTYALPFSSPVGSVALAALFGLGTMVSPLLVLGGVTGWLLNKAPLFKKYISFAGGAILISLGIITVVSSMLQMG